MKKVMTMAALSGMFLMTATPAMAADSEKVSFEVGADVVSSYIWRGQDCGGMSAQPSATITLNETGLSLGVWASAELFQTSQFANMNEFDLTLSWSPVEALTIGLTDYHFCDGDYWGRWDFSGASSHNLELNLGYDFGALAITWNTCLTGSDYKADGDRAYSSYCEVSAPFKLGGMECSGAVGIVPWEDSFTTGGENGGFNVVNVALTASKEVGKLPVMGQIVFNPQTEATYFVIGVSF